MDLVGLLASDAGVREAARLAAGGKRVLVRGSQGSSGSFLAAAAARLTGRTVVYVVGHLDEADETLDELTAAGPPVEAVRLPALEVLPGESGVSLELFAERLGVVRGLVPGSKRQVPSVVVCPIQALMQPVPGAASLDALARTVRVRQRLEPGDLARWLGNAGYERVEAVEEPGQFAVRGGIVDVFPPGGAGEIAGGVPVRLDFSGDEVEKITEIDLETMASDRAAGSVEFMCASLEKVFGAVPVSTPKGERGKHSRGGLDAGGGEPEPVETVSIDATGGAGSCSFLDYVPRDAVVVLHEPLEVTEQARGYFERLTDPRIYGPPAVLKRLQGFGYIEVSQFSGAKAAGDVEVELPVIALGELAREPGEAVKELAGIVTSTTGSKLPVAPVVSVFCENAGELSRLGELIDEFAPEAKSRIEATAAYVHRGFVWGGEGGVHVVPYHELLHRFETRRRFGAVGRAKADSTRLRAARAMDTFLDFAPGDYVVHRDHGIALFKGLVVMRPREVKREGPVVLPSDRPKDKAKNRRGAAGYPEADPDEGMEEYLALEFAGAARLYVPATKIDQVQKYIGGFRGSPTLSSLGGTRWKKQKEAVSESVKDLASEMLRIRAARESQPGVRYPADTAWQKEFEAEFPFTETDDQLAAIAEIKKDMQSDRPMDRLLCGDVGYGKTEVAMRGAFKAIEYGKQVAVLVPTTVLAEQHERTFKSRFADYPFRIESISRFKTNAEVNKVLADLRKGQVDIVIGTHRLLSKDVRFADLGLVVIDEEQRFGVEHKERLLSFRLTVDVLTLSATPIPRTLHLSMLGLRDISSLATAPMDRRAVVTEVIPYNAKRVQQAIAREMSRDGQVFFVHNRVFNIQTVADEIQKLAPEAKIVVGHGQMPDGELEQVMLKFMRRQADVLVSTTIIESGIDIPTANTMFINDADRFGLADLHQLRGRVGRYKHRAYCYMLLSPDRTVAEKAVKRLKAIEEFSMLGAGFKIAMRDLEIRGAGNILGPEQSGHIAAVGYEMYCQLLDRAVKELRHEPTQQVSETSIEIGVNGMVPKRYIPSDMRRMEAYRRIAVGATHADLEKIETELGQAYGEPLPAATLRLLELAALRVAASALAVRSIAVRGQDVLLRARPGDADRIAERLGTDAPEEAADGKRRPGAGAGEFKLTVLAPKQKEEMAEVYFRPPGRYMEPNTLLRVLRTRLRGAAVHAAA